MVPAVIDAATRRASQIDRGARIQLVDPAVVARVDARRVDPGDEIRARLVLADPATGRVGFERVA